MKVELGHASCLLTIPQGYPDNVKNTSFELSCMETEKDWRDMGEATKLLEHVCEQADATKKALILNPMAYDGDVSDDSLQKWYAKHGFVVFQTKTKELPCLMVRVPK
jgi:GNAT superfamily N-acetyltransferase